jgi:tripartite ATP-independent transporter DctM subunit
MIWIFIGTFLISLILSVPLCFVIGFSSLLFLYLNNFPLLVVAQRLFSGLDSFPLLAVPFFILAGSLMNTGGITRRLVNFAHILVGHIKGGLAHTNIVVSMLFAGITGSAVADTSAIGGILIPAMVKKGYDNDFSAAVTASSSVIGPIIPPSILMVIYGVTTGLSIGGLFMAGFIPGILLGLSLMLVSYIYAVKRNYPYRDKIVGLKEFLSGLKDAFIALMAPVIVIGGILSGIFTPTEASVIAVIYAFIVSKFIYKELAFSDIPEILFKTAITTGTVLIIIGTASIMGWVISVQQIDELIVQFFMNIAGNKYILLLLINILLLFVGTFLEAGAAIIILAPVLAPLAIQMGVHPLHFGIIMVLNLVLGLITPPLGICLFVACSISKIKLWTISKAIFPFLLAEIFVLFIVTYFPVISMFIPKLFGYY